MPPPGADQRDLRSEVKMARASWRRRIAERPHEMSSARRRRSAWRGFETLEPRTLMAVALIRDINTVDQFPASITAAGAVYFTQNTPATGVELFMLGQNGAQLVTDVRPGPASSNPTNLTAVGARLFFTTDYSENGRHVVQLWTTDGSANGTAMLGDFSTTNQGGPNGDPIADFHAVGATLYFTTPDGHNGRELWRSDGTMAGTMQVQDIYNPGSTDPTTIHDELTIGANLYFNAGGFSSVLWRSDGTPGGTVPISGANLDYAFPLTAVGPTIYFFAYDSKTTAHGLWKSDGTAGGTAKIKDIGAPQSFGPATAAGTTLFFSANDGKAGYELWTSDGTATGTVMLKDIDAGATGSYPRDFTPIGKTLFFTAQSGGFGRQLWCSDGTAGGTIMLTANLPVNFQTQSMSVVGSTLFMGVSYTALDGDSALELLRSDGTVNGTTKVRDLANTAYFEYGSAPLGQFTASGGQLFFVDRDPNSGVELFVSDEAGDVMMVKDIRPGAGSSFPQSLTDLNGMLYFAAHDTPGVNQLWRSDGTAAGTVKLASFSPGATKSSESFGFSGVGFAQLGSTIVFPADDGSHGQELWRTDGTTAGTSMLRDINPGAAASFPRSLTIFNGAVYFAAQDMDSSASEESLWRTDGTSAGTTRVKQFSSIDTYYNRPFASAGGMLFFSADDGTLGSELWKVGSDGAVSLVKDIDPGSDGSNPNYLTPLGGKLYFVARDAQSYSIWKSDGSDPGTVKINLGPNVTSKPDSLAAVGSTVFFSAKDLTGSYALWKLDTSTGIVAEVKAVQPFDLTPVGSTLFFEANGGLWVSDGTDSGTKMIRNINVDQLTNAGGRLFFFGDDGAHGSEPWISDGTVAGTVMLKDINPGANGSKVFYSALPRTLGTLTYFVATDPDHGAEPWRTDGTPAGTTLVADINTGPGDANPSLLGMLNGNLVVTADDGIHGIEPLLVGSNPNPNPGTGSGSNPGSGPGTSPGNGHGGGPGTGSGGSTQPTDTTPPRIVSVSLTHAAASRRARRGRTLVLQVRFNEPLDRARAQDVVNYRLAQIRKGHGRKGAVFQHPIGLLDAQYDATTLTVSLTVAGKASLPKGTQLTVVAGPPGSTSGIIDTAGNHLAGKGAAPGTDAVIPVS
jgi:ELWxxDGT repeat protein